MNKIKLVYNWIGPKGPVWNTEVPNILNLAHMSEGINHLDTTKFFGDDLVKFFDCQSLISEYEIYPSVSIRHGVDTRPFIMPFTLAWRIPFSLYFSGNEGILEYSHAPYHVVNNVRYYNGYILINHSIEAFMQHNYLDAMHSYFGSVHNIPLNKIIYLTGCINANEVYEHYCSIRGIPNEPGKRLSIVTHPVSFTSFVQNTENESDTPPYEPDEIPPKLFLMWNRRLRDHRIELAVNLERYNLVDRSLISFSSDDQDYPGRSAVHKFNFNRLEHIFNIDPSCTQRFIDRLPLVLDGANDITNMCQDYGNATRSYYQQSLVSIVTETNFYEHEISLTEKSFKPTKEKHPFIIAGVRGVLKGMHELGFKTFSDFWDESYDDIVDNHERMNKIMDVVREIGEWTPEQILDFRHKVKDILDHNYNVIRNASTINAVSKITNIVRNRL